jgi:phage/plasmid-like protein (TIGR03299 family)
MSANVEDMFSVRAVPWHGIGTIVEEAPNSEEALKLGGLDWEVIQEPAFITAPETNAYVPVSGYKVNIRSTDREVLGIVTERYKVVQNKEAFSFTDSLLGEGVRYETAGVLNGGRRVWMLARFPDKWKVLDDQVTLYVVFTTSHDGTWAIKVAVTPIRVVCQNTLNLALHDARRIWTTTHIGNLEAKMHEAQKTLLYAERYMEHLQDEAENLNKIHISSQQLMKMIELLLPIPEDCGATRETNMDLLRTDLKMRYLNAPDLQNFRNTGWKFINAVSDFATHVNPLRRTETNKENLFEKTLAGNAIIDKAYELVTSLA